MTVASRMFRERYYLEREEESTSREGEVKGNCAESTEHSMLQNVPGSTRHD
jgi:hypothetical protein